ncbi:MAG: AMP-binding protein [Actinomycetota bacterium]
MIASQQSDRGDVPAVIDEWGATSWSEIDERTNRLIHHLRGAGVQPGDRVALLSGNRREIEEVYLSCMHAGWHCVPINWHFAADEVAYVLADSGASALVASSAYAGLAAEALTIEPDSVSLARLAMAPHEHEVVPDALESYEEALAAADPAEPDGQMLGGVMFYTSGTTGRPKGVRSTSWQPETPVEVLSLMASSVDGLGIPPHGRTLLCGPQYHSAQWAFSFLPLVAGSTVVMQAKFIPEQTLTMIDEHQVTNTHLVPTQFVRLLRVDSTARDAFDGSSLVAVLHGAAPCAPDVKRSMIDWWGPKISEYYGATEGGIVTMITADEWLERPGSVGTSMPIVEVKVVNALGETAAPNEEGVIHVRSLVGQDFEYLNAPEKTAEAHSEPGFMTMGDIGYLDDAGYLYLSDRKIDMIISGGVNIYPAEVEAVLISHPSVLDVAVFGVPNEEFGEEVKATVQLVDDVEWSDDLAAELDALARQHLAGYKRPRSFDVVDEMPRSAAGKLLKRRLREPYWAGTGRSI